tara:strand:+ start:45 stop:683 length:639 start_codon:yes stop_codon:yes gene_type:complete
LEKDKVILVPSYNELASLKIICKKLKKHNLHFIILDDCSTDGTEKWLRKNKIKFIRNRKNLGYERNLISGFYRICKFNKIKSIITFDGDGQHKTGDILKLIKLKYDQNFDLVICNRKKMNRWSEKILSFFFKIKYRVKDPITGFKIYKKVLLKKLLKNISNNHFLVDIIFLAIKKNCTIKNFTISTNVKKHSRIGENVKTHLKILKNLKFII